jgi:hypothetical protein
MMNAHWPAVLCVVCIMAVAGCCDSRGRADWRGEDPFKGAFAELGIFAELRRDADGKYRGGLWVDMPEPSPLELRRCGDVARGTMTVGDERQSVRLEWSGSDEWFLLTVPGPDKKGTVPLRRFRNSEEASAFFRPWVEAQERARRGAGAASRPAG